MSYSHHEAPRELIAVIWSIAGTLALFFAIAVSSLFIIKRYYPVDASTVTSNSNPVASTNCKEGESSIAINNYPGETAILAAFPKSKTTEYAHGKIEEALGGNYQCSNLCVPGLDTTKAANDATNVAKIKSYLEGATSCKTAMTLYANGTEFMTYFKNNQNLKAELQASVVLSSTKGKCAGSTTNIGNSKAYCQIELKSKEKARESEANTTTQDKSEQDTAKEETSAKQTEQKDETSSAKTSGQTAGESLKDQPKDVSIPTNPTSNKQTAQSSGTDIDTCTNTVNQFIYKYEELLKGIAEQYRTESDPDYTRFTEIKNGYQELKKEPLKSDEAKALVECHKLEAKVTYLSDKLWGSKTVLAKCKNDVEKFIKDYGSKKVTEPATSYYLKVQDWSKSLRKNPYYLTRTDKAMKLCEEAKSMINNYSAAVKAAEASAAEKKAKLDASLSRLESIRHKNITYQVTGKVYWSYPKNLSKHTVVCIANTKSAYDARPYGNLTRVTADNYGYFVANHIFNADMLPYRGVAILIYDPGAGLTKSRDVLYTSDATEFNSIVLRQMVDGKRTYVLGNLGSVNLQKGVGGSRALRDKFYTLTGQHCN